MATKFEVGTRVIHPQFGYGVIQPTFTNLHPSMPDDVIFVKLEVIPENCTEIVQVDADSCRRA